VSLRTRFPAGDVAELRVLQQRVRSLLDPTALAPGWHHDVVDPERVVETFDLWVRDGFRLRLHHHVGPAGVACVMWGFRGDAEEPTDWDAHSGAHLPPPPASALDNPLEAVAGAPGAWSFLCASVLARELAALGATGAFAGWTKQTLVDETLPPVAPQAWRQDAPDDPRPLVIEDNNGTTVRFLTHRPDPARVYRHEDRYPGDDLDAHARQVLLAAEDGSA